MDIKAAFDTIDQDKVLEVIEGLLDKVSCRTSCGSNTMKAEYVSITTIA